jgi:hypothetical protein
MRREAEERERAPRYSYPMLTPRDSIANRLPIAPNPYAVQPVQEEEEVQIEQQPVITKCMFVAQEPDLETVIEVEHESDTSWTSATSDSEFPHDSSATSS